MPHYGTDLTTAQGTAIKSFASGTVSRVGYSKTWGNYVVVDHGKKYFTLYANIKKGGTLVKEGDEVKDGGQLGKVGSTGLSTGPHLHFEVGQANNVDEFLSKKDRSKHRENAAEIGDLEKLLHPENPDDSENSNDTKSMVSNGLSQSSPTEQLIFEMDKAQQRCGMR